jgi:F-type H+-transporting ATPase subunit delta
MKGNSVVSSQVAEPYAQALLSLAQSNNLTDEFGSNAASILDTLNASSELQQFLENPFAKADAKKAVLKQIFGGQVHPFVENFLMLLVDRGRIMFLGGVCEQYQALLRKLKGIVLAEVTAAVELNDAQKDQVKQQVQRMTGANAVEIATKVDPELLGGMVIKAGSQVIDASLKGQLRQISLRLAGIA